MAAHACFDSYRPLLVRLFESTFVELSTTEVGLAQIGSVELAASQISSAERCAPQIDEFQIGLA